MVTVLKPSNIYTIRLLLHPLMFCPTLYPETLITLLIYKRCTFGFPPHLVFL